MAYFEFNRNIRRPIRPVQKAVVRFVILFSLFSLFPSLVVLAETRELLDGRYKGFGTLRIDVAEDGKNFTGRFLSDLDSGGQQVLCQFEVEGKKSKGNRIPIKIQQENSKVKVDGSIHLSVNNQVSIAVKTDLKGDCAEYFTKNAKPDLLKFDK